MPKKLDLSMPCKLMANGPFQKDDQGNYVDYKEIPDCMRCGLLGIDYSSRSIPQKRVHDSFHCVSDTLAHKIAEKHGVPITDHEAFHLANLWSHSYINWPNLVSNKEVFDRHLQNIREQFDDCSIDQYNPFEDMGIHEGARTVNLKPYAVCVRQPHDVITDGEGNNWRSTQETRYNDLIRGYDDVPLGECTRCGTYDSEGGHLPWCHDNNGEAWAFHGEHHHYVKPLGLNKHQLYHFANWMTEALSEHFQDTEAYPGWEDVDPDFIKAREIYPRLVQEIHSEIKSRGGMQACDPEHYNPFEGLGIHEANAVISEEELKDVENKGINKNIYRKCRFQGATHDEVLDARSKGIDLYDYYYTKDLGASHNEILEAKRKAVDLYHYRHAKLYGATHDEILDANEHCNNEGVGLDSYKALRSCGANHEESLEAIKSKIIPFEYELNREQGKSHQQIMMEKDPGYNPFEGLGIVEGAKKFFATAPCFYHNHDYTPDGLGNYVNQDGDLINKPKCLRCGNRMFQLGGIPGTPDYGKWAHSKNCCSDVEAKALADYYGLSINDHQAYHLANSISVRRMLGMGLDIPIEVELQKERFKNCADIGNPFEGLGIVEGMNISKVADTIDPAQINDARKRKINHNAYIYCRYQGATHDEVVDAYNRGLNLYEYMYAREGKNSHINAIIDLDNTYNPFERMGIVEGKKKKFFATVPCSKHNHAFEPDGNGRYVYVDEEDRPWCSRCTMRRSWDNSPNASLGAMKWYHEQGCYTDQDAKKDASEGYDLTPHESYHLANGLGAYMSHIPDSIYGNVWNYLGNLKNGLTWRANLNDLIRKVRESGALDKCDVSQQSPFEGLDIREGAKHLDLTVPCLIHPSEMRPDGDGNYTMLSRNPLPIGNPKYEVCMRCGIIEPCSRYDENDKEKIVYDHRDHELIDGNCISDEEMKHKAQDLTGLRISNHEAYHLANDFSQYIQDYYDGQEQELPMLDQMSEEKKNKFIINQVHHYKKNPINICDTENYNPFKDLGIHEGSSTPYTLESIGVTPDQFLEAQSKGIRSDIYGHIRLIGATHEEALDAHEKGINLNLYDLLRSRGIPHNEVLGAYIQGVPMDDYRMGRYIGATHDEILDAHKKGFNTLNYWEFRYAGANHPEALEALNSRLHPTLYGDARSAWGSHQKAMMKLDDDYNPFEGLGIVESSTWYDGKDMKKDEQG